MYVKTFGYENPVYHVSNPQDCPLKRGADTIVCAGFTQEGTQIGAHGAEVISLAKKFNPDWCFNQPKRAYSARYDVKKRVFYRGELQ